MAPDGTPILAAAQEGDPSSPPGIGHNGGPPLGDPPKIPEQQPETRREKTSTAKSLARWLAAAKNSRNSRTRVIVVLLDLAIRATGWLADEQASIDSYQDPPKSLEELQQAANDPQPGYDIHHIVEQTAARNAGFPEEMIEGSQNLVRVPRYKHQEITGWYATRNKDLGGLSPRQYLQDKSWEERYKMGIDALIEAKVMKP